MKKGDLKKFLNKFWSIVWKDNSPKGWIITLIFLFVVIKLIFFPLLSLTTGTSLPLVIVESCSMYHDGDPISNFDKWWDSHNNKYLPLQITKETFQKFTLAKGFNKGDILFITGAKPEKLEIGDIIIFTANFKNPIIHRIIDIQEKQGKYFFSTMGDNNNGQLSFEKEISQEQIIGKASFNIAPYLGWGKLIFFELAKELDSNKNTNFDGFCEEN